VNAHHQAQKAYKKVEVEGASSGNAFTDARLSKSAAKDSDSLRAKIRLLRRRALNHRRPVRFAHHTLVGIIGQKFDSVQIERTMSNFAGDPHRLFRLWRPKFNINLRSHAQVGQAEKAHPTFAQVDTERVHMSGCR